MKISPDFREFVACVNAREVRFLLVDRAHRGIGADQHGAGRHVDAGQLNPVSWATLLGRVFRWKMARKPLEVALGKSKAARL